MRRSIGARPPKEDRQLEALNRLVDSAGLLEPTEGETPAVLLDAFLRSFLDHGYERVVVADEFGERYQEFRVDSLLAERHAFVPEAHPSIFSLDASLVYCVPWDSFFTLLCGSHDRLSDTVNRHGFEGFWCDESTTLEWPLPLREPGSDPT
jgi:hypothetical protein